MALHHTAVEHDADPPSAWRVQKQRVGRRWNLVDARGAVLDDFETRKAAEAAKHSGFWLKSVYADEGRRFHPPASLDWEPSREVKGLQGAIHMDVPVHIPHRQQGDRGDPGRALPEPAGEAQTLEPSPSHRARGPGA